MLGSIKKAGRPGIFYTGPYRARTDGFGNDQRKEEHYACHGSERNRLRLGAIG